MLVPSLVAQFDLFCFICLLKRSAHGVQVTAATNMLVLYFLLPKLFPLLVRLVLAPVVVD
jgi:hypothetical protein